MTSTSDRAGGHATGRVSGQPADGTVGHCADRATGQPADHSTDGTAAHGPALSADPRSGTILPGPRALYRTFATAEMFTWAALILAMILKYSGVTDALMPISGGLHGFVFLCYAVVAVGVWINQRWSAGRGIAAVGLAVVPFATLPFERYLARRGEPDHTWRLASAPGRPAETPRGFWEVLEAWVLRNVVLAAVLTVVVVTVVFLLLLNAGPPTEWVG